MLVLIENAVGYGLFKADKTLRKADAATVEDLVSKRGAKLFELDSFKRFESTEQCVTESSAIAEGKVPVALRGFLKKHVPKKSELLVVDKSLAKNIADELKLTVKFSSTNTELARAINSHFFDLVEGVKETDVRQMTLSLSHGLSRFKLKFSPEKVDTMIIQAVGLLDDIDKEANTFTMRLKEWYAWHFPEAVTVIPEGKIFADFVLAVGRRENVKSMGSELNDLLGDEAAKEIRVVAETSHGSVLADTDVLKFKQIAADIVELMDYRTGLATYLKDRMEAIAPNVTCMVGELVAARLLAHAGSLLNLAKHPASTIQILGAEKALFRALKAKKPTPKYGIIYHVSAVGQANPAVKGTISRILANKIALCARVDAFGAQPGDVPTIGIAARQAIETKLAELQDQVARGERGVKRPMHHQRPVYANDRSSGHNKRRF